MDDRQTTLGAIEGYLASKADGGDALAIGLHGMLTKFMRSGKLPTVVVDMAGGLVQNITASEPVRVIVLDGDIEGSSLDAAVIDGEEVIVFDNDPVEISSACIDSVVRQVEALRHTASESPCCKA